MEQNQQNNQNSQQQYSNVQPNQPYGGIPEEIKGWNWGAFMFSIVWGIGNKVYWPLLSLVPYLGFIMVIVTGIKGNEWAWKSGEYTDVNTFLTVQNTWNRAGKVMFFVALAIIVFAILVLIVTGASLLQYAARY